MHSLYVDDQTQSAKGALSWHIARHMYMHQQRGRAVIVTNTPAELLTAVQKQWLKLTRQVQRERSETINTAHIIELTHHISCMQSLRFTADENGTSNAQVMFNTPQFLLQNPPSCHTLYIASAIPKATAYLITSWMPRHGLVVVYAPFADA